MAPDDGGTGQGAGAGQGSASSQGNSGGSQGSSQGSGDQVLGPDGKPLDPQRAAQALARLRALPDTVKEKDTKIAELEQKIAELENAKLTETQRQAKRLAELEAEKLGWDQERQQLRLGSALTAAATKAGAVHPDAVRKLVDLATVEYDKDGAPTNLDKVVEAVKKAYPSLFGTNGSADGGARTSAGGGEPDMNALLRRAAGRH